MEEINDENIHSGWICSCGNWIWTTDVSCEMCGTTYIDLDQKKHMKSLKDFIFESKLDSMVSKCKTFGDVMKNFMGITSDPDKHPVDAQEDLINLFETTDMPHLFKKPGDKNYWINPSNEIDATEAAKAYLHYWNTKVKIDVQPRGNCDTLVIKLNENPNPHNYDDYYSVKPGEVMCKFDVVV